jgi:starvation-inducible outer membrane lipoprotein
MAYRQALVLALLLLTGCSTIEKQAEEEKKQDKVAQADAVAAENAIDDTRCQSFGYKRGTPAYLQCMKDYENAHEQLGISYDK